MKKSSDKSYGTILVIAIAVIASIVLDPTADIEKNYKSKVEDQQLMEKQDSIGHLERNTDHNLDPSKELAAEFRWERKKIN